MVAAVGALKVLTFAQHALQALSMEEVALALAHLHDIYLFQVARLLIFQQLHLRLCHRLNVLIELPVAYRAILLLQLAPVDLLNIHFLLFCQFALQQLDKLFHPNELPIRQSLAAILHEFFALLPHLLNQLHILGDCPFLCNFFLDTPRLLFKIDLVVVTVTPPIGIFVIFVFIIIFHLFIVLLHIVIVLSLLRWLFLIFTALHNIGFNQK